MSIITDRSNIAINQGINHFQVHPKLRWQTEWSIHAGTRAQTPLGDNKFYK